VSKKTKKPIKSRKSGEQITEKIEPWKKPIKILKNRPVRFYKLETEKTKPK
jgi:5-bromo-4-chloroindolyl phosphate hydrolysis protein